MIKIYRVWLIVLILSLAVSAQTEYVRVKVKDIHDGDTITVSDASKKHFKIRLIGVDAPELKQKYGDKARRELKKILKKDKKKIIVKTFGLDLYKRILAQVFVGQIDVNLELLKLGFAWVYDSKELDATTLADYRKAMLETKNKKVGLWFDENLIDPKEFRQKKREKSKKQK